MKKKPFTETEVAIVVCVFSFILCMILFGSHSNFKLEKLMKKKFLQTLLMWYINKAYKTFKNLQAD